MQPELAAFVALFLGREQQMTALAPYRRALEDLHHDGRVRAAKHHGIQHFALVK